MLQQSTAQELPQYPLHHRPHPCGRGLAKLDRHRSPRPAREGTRRLAAELEANWCPQFELLATPFEIVPGVVIPPGSYRFTRSRIQAQTSQHRSLQASSTTCFGSFYDGSLTQWQQSLQWASGQGRVQIGVSVENDFGHLRERKFVQRLWQTQWAFAWSPDLVLTSSVQYDTESRNLGASARLRWTIRPGSDLFIVWSRGWQRLVLDPHDRSLIPDNQLVAVKLKWTFRM